MADNMLDKIRAKQAAQGNVPAPEAKPRPIKRPPAGKGRPRGKGKPPGKKRPYRLTPQGLDEKLYKKGRLPHRSEYTCVWDETRNVWVQVLRIPQGNPDGGVYTNYTLECDGLFKGLHLLDGQYRESVKPKETT